MLELVLAVIAVCSLITNRLSWVFLVISILYKSGWYFGLSTSDLLFYHNLPDLGALIIIAVFFRLNARKSVNRLYEYKKIRSAFKYFFLFFLLCSLIDIVVNHTPLISQIKALRGYIPLILLLVIHKVRREEILAYLKLLIVISTLFSFIFVLEQIIGVEITGARHTSGGARAPVVPPITLLCFAVMLVSKHVVSTKLKILFFISLFSNLVASGSRSIFLSYIFVFCLFLISSKPTVKKTILVVFACIAVAFVFSTDNILSKRFNESKGDIASVQANSGEVEGNFSFRILLMSERLEYVANSVQYTLFGIGNIEERNIKREIFHIGLKDDKGRVYQVETADIAWAVAFLRWGILGTILYLLVPFRQMILYYYRNRKIPYSYGLFLYLCANLFVTSWTYSDITSMDFWFAPIVFLPLVQTSSINRDIGNL